MNVPKLITSLTNDRVKAIRALDMRKVRRETGMFVAEGTSLLITARDNGRLPETLVYQAGTADSGIIRGLVASALKAGSEVLEVSEAVLAKLSSKDNAQSVIGVFRQQFAPLPAPSALRSEETWIALEDIRDPGNLGTIIRTADAAGAAGIILAGTTCDPYSLEAVRATMGSIFAVPIVRAERQAFLDLLKAWPGDVVATHLDGALDFRQAAPKGPELIVMGAEGPGLSPEAAAEATMRVKIPMAGQLDSLNLAVATALVLYQVRRDRLKL